MRITYYPDTDTFYLQLKEARIENSEEIAPGTVLDYNSEGRMVGVEIYAKASSKVDLDKLLLERKEESGTDASLEVETTFMTKPVEITRSNNVG